MINNRQNGAGRRRGRGGQQPRQGMSGGGGGGNSRDQRQIGLHRALTPRSRVVNAAWRSQSQKYRDILVAHLIHVTPSQYGLVLRAELTTSIFDRFIKSGSPIKIVAELAAGQTLQVQVQKTGESKYHVVTGDTAALADALRLSDFLQKKTATIQ